MSFNAKYRHPENLIGKELTERQKQLLPLIVEGLENKEIADRLKLSEKTIKNHITRIMMKLYVQNRTQIAVWALREGICT